MSVLSSLSDSLDLFISSSSRSYLLKNLEAVYYIALTYSSLSLKAIGYKGESSIYQDCSLEYINRILQKREVTPSGKVLNSIINYTKSKAHNTTEEISSNHGSYELSFDEVLLLRSVIKESTKSLPLGIKFLVFYFLRNPELLPSYLKGKISIKKTVVAEKIFTLRGEIAMQEESDLKMLKIPNDRLSRLLVLSSIYKLSPIVFVLFTLTKSIPKVIQFLELFSKELKLPTSTEFKNSLQVTTNLIAKYEKGEVLNVEEMEYLSCMLTDISSIEELTDSSSFSPVLGGYIERLLDESIDSIRRVNNTVISQINYSDPQSIASTYKVMTEEITKQLELMSKILDSVLTSKDVSGLARKLVSPID